MERAEKLRQTANKLAGAMGEIEQLLASPSAELALVAGEFLAVAVFHLERAADADEADDEFLRDMHLAAASAGDVLSRRIVHELGRAIGEARMPWYRGAIEAAEEVHARIAAVANVVRGLELPGGPEERPSGEAVEAAVDVFLPLLSAEQSDAATLAIAAACIGSLREGVSPREWLHATADALPAAPNETRELGTLSMNPEAVATMMRAATRFRTAQSLTSSRRLRRSGERPPYAQIIEDLSYGSTDPPPEVPDDEVARE